MWLSQQHRVLISDWRAALLFGENEVLVPINKLVNGTTIDIDTTLCEVTYVHLCFDHHEIVEVDGVPSESFLPDAAASSTCPATAELAMLFPEFAGRQGTGAARPCIEDRCALALLDTAA
jgi:hypothetical protein